MGHMIEKIRKMDKISVGLELLVTDLQKCYEENYQEQWRKVAYNRLTELKNDSNELHLEITGLLDKIQGLIAGALDDELYSMVYSFVQKTQDIFNKLYLYNVHSEETYKEECIENYYGTQYEKNALLIYILHPFIFEDMVPEHTNQVEVKIIAETLREKGYNVDLVNTRYLGKIDSEKYDVVLGAGKAFEELCCNHGERTKAIYYLTTASSYFNNVEELKRLCYFEKRNHYKPQFERISMDLLNLPAMAKADAAICLGNEHTASTYEGVFSQIYPLNVTGFSDFRLPDIQKSHGTKSFLWYGGTGPIHKGLDLCIEAFRSLPDLKLHIVGEVTTDFYNVYRQDIEDSENVLYYGFLKKDSEVFKQVCEECTYCIFPSCSEGQSTSVVSTLFSGVIPVCTRAVGIDVEKAGGVWIENIEVDALADLMKNLSGMDCEEVAVRQQKAYEYAVTNHTERNYKEALHTILNKILG